MAFNDIKADLKDAWINIKGNDLYVKGVLIAAIGLIGLTIGISMTLQPAPIVKQTPENAIKRSAQDLDGYLDPFPPRVEVKPEIREVVKIIERDPPPEVKEIDPRDIFTFREPEPPEVDQEDLKRAQINAGRKSYTWKRKREKYTPYGYDSDFQDVSRDLDFSAHNVPRATPTYPVDLTRVFTADRFISATLISEIRSELPSQKVIAQVETDIYATQGRKILIPRGSRAIGTYEPLDENGATRLQIVWDRILTPDGINIKFDSETADQQGSSGITGSVDNRIKDRYAAALLFSSISALAQLSVDADDEQQVAAANAGTEEFGTLTAELLRDSLDIVPRVTIERGTRVLISPLTDLWFKPATIDEIQVVKLKVGEKG